MKVINALLALTVLLGGAVCAQERVEDFPFRAPLTLTGDGPWYRVDLPMAVHFAAAHGDLRDLRVFNEAGQAQAYALISGRDQTDEHEQEHGVRWFPLHADGERDGAPQLRVQRSTSGTLIELSDERLPQAGRQLRGWLLDASAIDAPLVSLTLDWSGGDEGFQRFSIEASDDLKSWQRWGEGQVARLSFADERIDQRQVELPGQRGRYLRLLWLGAGPAPQLQVATVRSRVQDRRPAPLVWSEPLALQRLGDGVYQWQLPAALALERMRVPVLQANTLAPVQVQARESEQQPWRGLVSGLLYRLPQDGQDVQQEELALPGWPVRELRMQVDGRGGGLGEPTPQVQVAVRATQLVFLARGEPPYQLVMGNASARSAALPMTVLMPGEGRTERLASAQLDEISGLLEPVEAGVDAADSTGWKRLGLWAVLLLGVGLLAGMALSLVRRPPDT